MASLIQTVKNFFNPIPTGAYVAPQATEKQIKRNLNQYPSKQQLDRTRQDIQSWREAAQEAENIWTPSRVKMQRLFIDTILNGHVEACIKRRKTLTLLRQWEIKQGDKVNENMTKLLNEEWFASLLGNILDAKFFGYTLVSLGDLEDSKFPNSQLVRRWFINPDRMIVTNMIYSQSGINFTEKPYSDWHVWVATPTDVGASTCGYGLLYKVAMYEIICRNLLGFNMDAAELFGMPLREVVTDKTEESERGELFQAAVNMGSSGVILHDSTDEIKLVERSDGGAGYGIYENLELRCEKKISKIILGHADALDSIPGKLGNDGEESPAQQAMEDIQTEDGTFIENVINGQVIPKLRNLGFTIPEDAKFCFSNNAEIEEIKEKKNVQNKTISDTVKTMKDAGLQADAKWFEQETGIPTTAVVEPAPQPQPTGLSNKVKNKLELLYP